MNTPVDRPVDRCVRCVLAAAALAGALVAAGCAGNNRQTANPRSVTPVARDIPAALRNTIGAETSMRGVRPTVASGIGFVVGLNGTGGLPIPEDIAGHLEREMSLGGIGQTGTYEGTALDGVTPRRLLQDRNTAAVLVSAAIPPGAREGTRFDVFVTAINATSLEGGRLWTTDLNMGTPSRFGGPQTRRLATARGQIFINPFAEPGQEMDGVTRTSGRILDGGVAIDEMVVEIVLDNPSHSRARAIASAVNARFPEGAGDRGQTARGRDSERIHVRVPERFRDRSEEFVEMVRHLPIDQSYPEVYARRFADALRAQPYLASDLSWCLQAVGERALPFLQELYNYPEARPRLAALRAGAALGDARTAPHLREMATRGPADLRSDAIALLGRLEAGPTVDQTLRDLLNASELTIRVAAYEALAKRAEMAQRRRLLASERIGGGPSASERITVAGLRTLSQVRLPAGTLQGVSRDVVAGKFFIDRVPVGDPMVYVTQQGTPRIVLFGDDLRLRRPILTSMWSDRLMLTADSDTDDVRLYFRDHRSGRTVIQTVPDDLEGLIDFLAHTQSPEDPRPGLALTYSEVVGVLHGLYRARAIDASFTTERDRLLAELSRASRGEEIEMRPATAEDRDRVVVFEDPDTSVVPRRETRPPGERPSLLVPLRPAEGEENGQQNNRE